MKLFMEDSFGAAADWPLMSDVLVDEIIGHARGEGLKIVVHANALDMQELALDHAIDVLAHGLWNRGDRSGGEVLPDDVEAHLAPIAKLGIGFQPTFGVMRGIADLFVIRLVASGAMIEVMPGPRQRRAWQDRKPAIARTESARVGFGL